MNLTELRDKKGNLANQADQILTNYDYDATLEGLVAALDRGDSSRA